MGNIYSLKNENKKSDKILSDITKVVNIVEEKYSKDFLNPNFCDEISEIFIDKMQTYSKRELNQIKTLIGLDTTDDLDFSKKDMCAKIVNHYKNIVVNIRMVLDKLNIIQNRIDAITVGPFCKDNPTILDMQQCVNTNSIWILHTTPPNISIPQNKNFYEQLKILTDDYHKRMKTILYYLNSLKFDNINKRLIIEINDKINFELNKLDILSTNIVIKLNEMKKYDDDDILKEKQEQLARLTALKKASVTQSVIDNRS